MLKNFIFTHVYYWINIIVKSWRIFWNIDLFNSWFSDSTNNRKFVLKNLTVICIFLTHLWVTLIMLIWKYDFKLFKQNTKSTVVRNILKITYLQYYNVCSNIGQMVSLRLQAWTRGSISDKQKKLKLFYWTKLHAISDAKIEINRF